MNSQEPAPAWTIGHSTLRPDGFVERLAGHRIERIADVRRYPASRRSPWFNRETLAELLEARNVEYRWFEDLGGRRSGFPPAASPNRGLESAGFRSYADYMATEPFRRAFDELVTLLESRRTALLCAETLWWRCHRRLLADQLVARGGMVYHILDVHTTERHALWDLARVTPAGLFYPPTQTELGLDL